MFTLIVLLVFIRAEAQRLKVTEKQRIERTFPMSSEKRFSRIMVDNIAGDIHADGYDGNEIRLVVEQNYRAESEERLKEAKQEIVLQVEEQGERLVLYVETPWRDQWGGRSRDRDFYGYDARFDFQLKVPTKMMLYLKTVNEGEIDVKNVEGDFDFRNVNGGIRVNGIAGSGRMHTVNGPVEATFVKSPPSDCSFETVNGRIELEFPDDLAADLRFKTFNGEVYTDFDVEGLSRQIKPAENRKGRKVYSKDTWFGVRAGKGGPTYKFETLNGSIHILKNTR